MTDNPVSLDTLRRMPFPADLFVGTGSARPVSVRNVIAFCRVRSKELGARKSLHHRFVLCLNLHRASSIDLILNDVALRLAPGQYILFAPHQLHAYAGLDDRETAIMFVTFETDDDDLLYHLCNRVMELTPCVQFTVAGFIDVYTGDRVARHDNLVVLAAQGLIEAIIANDRDSGVDARLPVPAPLKDAMLKLTGPETHTVISVARESGFSEAYLRKLFKKHMGIPLGHYLAEIRHNRARSLIGASDESVSRIAELCGYKSVYGFSRSFRACNNCSPSQYRERIRNASSP